jgi:hypothetical protein
MTEIQFDFNDPEGLFTQIEDFTKTLARTFTAFEVTRDIDQELLYCARIILVKLSTFNNIIRATKDEEYKSLLLTRLKGCIELLAHHANLITHLKEQSKIVDPKDYHWCSFFPVHDIDEFIKG